MKQENVVALAKEPDPFTVDILEKWLEMARRGEITDLVMVAAGRDNDGERCYMNACSFEDCWRLLGALEHAKYNVSSGAPEEW